MNRRQETAIVKCIFLAMFILSGCGFLALACLHYSIAPPEVCWEIFWKSAVITCGVILPCVYLEEVSDENED